MTKNDTTALLLIAATNAAQEESSNHPQDIAYAMITAIEMSWPVVVAAGKMLDEQRSK